MSVIDLVFPARGGMVPLDHGYALFSALSHRLPGLHERRDVGLFNLRGTRAEGRSLWVGHGSMRVRCPIEAVPLFLPLTNAALVISEGVVTLGAPKVFSLEAPASLSARVVTFKHAIDDASFRSAVHKFLGEMSCEGRMSVGRRRVVTIAGKKVIGYGLTLSGLSRESSLRLQAQGLGGRRHMGCGVFLPTMPRVAVKPRVEQGLRQEVPPTWLLAMGPRVERRQLVG
ncbi:type I-MYXAN CRISPR-associated protein Cas6/Cmx6 [Myxococcus stipitatus]|uniref:type I-MYXAN CRISPR-associated protein Cas6/Cmx6 n=1 Tax=Myxococcus stipitatus TaxID=83455 RepID=UPI001F3FD63F|nr:type I-MYXAN CRISPR-associated protein Cas6/Cmx6 [Myxococcus stipitatus]MCE9671833.1 type I-MYXAN CRISPR-associated protein Cas6/Cmx6 [Myxococcus stipitatus]